MEILIISLISLLIGVYAGYSACQYLKDSESKSDIDISQSLNESLIGTEWVGKLNEDNPFNDIILVINDVGNGFVQYNFKGMKYNHSMSIDSLYDQYVKVK